MEDSKGAKTTQEEGPQRQLLEPGPAPGPLSPPSGSLLFSNMALARTQEGAMLEGAMLEGARQQVPEVGLTGDQGDTWGGGGGHRAGTGGVGLTLLAQV